MIVPLTYQTIPQTVEAMRFVGFGPQIKALADWVNNSSTVNAENIQQSTCRVSPVEPTRHLYLFSNGVTHIVNLGDWVVKLDDTFVVLTTEEFQKLYMRASE